jgi:hypothetical protein
LFAYGGATLIFSGGLALVSSLGAVAGLVPGAFKPEGLAG